MQAPVMNGGQLREGAIMRYHKSLLGNKWKTSHVVLCSDSCLKCDEWRSAQRRRYYALSQVASGQQMEYEPCGFVLGFVPQVEGSWPDGSVMLKNVLPYTCVGQMCNRMPVSRPIIPDGYSIDHLVAISMDSRADKVYWFLFSSDAELKSWFSEISKTIPQPANAPLNPMRQHPSAVPPPPPFAYRPPSDYCVPLGFECVTFNQFLYPRERQSVNTSSPVYAHTQSQAQTHGYSAKIPNQHTHIPNGQPQMNGEADQKDHAMGQFFEGVLMGCDFVKTFNSNEFNGRYVIVGQGSGDMYGANNDASYANPNYYDSPEINTTATIQAEPVLQDAITTQQDATTTQSCNYQYDTSYGVQTNAYNDMSCTGAVQYDNFGGGMVDMSYSNNTNF
uniref:PH domain-containing protein n=1 Tax=Steinernema glaseri TaxID=37863 RepID=A0A1I7YQD7_9BILA